jgi:drug/metabolite transporter (DMT)-like permease
MIFGAVLALLAAMCNALAAGLQQRASQLVVARRRLSEAPGGALTTRYLPVLRQVRWLLRHPVWWLGWVFNTLGTLVQAGALHFGSVAQVQPLLTTQLVFDLPLSARNARRRPLLQDWLSAVAICIGVIVFLAVPGAAPTRGAADRRAVLVALVASAAVVVLLIVLAAGRSGTVRAAVIGVAAGICNANTAVLIKLTTTDLADRGIAATAVDWPGYSVAIGTTLGVLLAQQAYAAGSLAVAVAAMTVTNPVVSTLLGRLTFDVPATGGVGALAALAVSLLLMSVGAVGLAHSPTVRGSPSPATSSTAKPSSSSR